MRATTYNQLFITDHPAEMSQADKKKAPQQNPAWLRCFELMINGKEIANAYTIQTNSTEQRGSALKSRRLMERGDEAMFH
jgi:lysyl-tRNA synthetase class 2